MTEQEYRDAKLAFGPDGIRLGSVHIMPSAERLVIRAEALRLCDEIKPRRVLELGFGLGYSAAAFQDYGVPVHTIVEAHPVIAGHARQWAKGRAGVTIIEGFAQTIRVPDGAWDLVFNDIYDVTGTLLNKARFVHARWFTCHGYGMERPVL